MRAGKPTLDRLRGRVSRLAARHVSDDAGSAVVEFVVLGTLMLVPVVYLVVALGQVQAGTFAAQGAAREAGRAFTTAQTEESAAARAEAAAAVAVADHGFGPADTSLDVSCDRTPCLSPESRVTTSVTVDVRLPAVPRFVDAVVPARVTLRARHVSVVDRFRAP